MRFAKKENLLALVVKTLDSAIHQIKIYPVDNTIGFPNTYIHWIVIYRVDNAIQHLNNQGQDNNVSLEIWSPYQVKFQFTMKTLQNNTKRSVQGMLLPGTFNK